MISLPTFRGVLSGFNPRSLSPALWLNDTGSDPSVWTDMSGNGRNASQSDPAKRPSIVTNALNGKQVRRFDGVNDFLSVTSGFNILRNVPGATIIAAYKWIVSPNDVKVVLNITIGSNNTSARATIAGGVPSQKYYAGGRRQDTDSFSYVSSANDITTSYSVHSGVFNYANSDLFQYINGFLDGQSTSFQTNGNTENSDSQAITIGAGSSQSSFSNIDLAEILVFPTALSDVNRQKVERYLSGKYAIAF